MQAGCDYSTQNNEGIKMISIAQSITSMSDPGLLERVNEQMRSQQVKAIKLEASTVEIATALLKLDLNRPATLEDIELLGFSPKECKAIYKRLVSSKRVKAEKREVPGHSWQGLLITDINDDEWYDLHDKVAGANMQTSNYWAPMQVKDFINEVGLMPVLSNSGQSGKARNIIAKMIAHPRYTVDVKESPRRVKVIKINYDKT